MLHSISLIDEIFQELYVSRGIQILTRTSLIFIFCLFYHASRKVLNCEKDFKLLNCQVQCLTSYVFAESQINIGPDLRGDGVAKAPGPHIFQFLIIN